MKKLRKPRNRLYRIELDTPEAYFYAIKSEGEMIISEINNRRALMSLPEHNITWIPIYPTTFEHMFGEI